MTLVDSTTRAPESTVLSPLDIAQEIVDRWAATPAQRAAASRCMPAARRLAAREPEIPSIRHLQQQVVSDFYAARLVHWQLRSEDPTAPVSGGAPTFDANTEATGSFPVLAAPLAAPVVSGPPAKHSERSRRTQTIALVVPLLLVNSAALYGQAGWAYDHLGHNRAVAVLFAAAVELIGVYLAAEAHGALMAGDASARLRLGSYLIGLLVGVLNYAHFAGPAYAPNPVALTFGLLSSISPWLWSIRSRSMNRDRLRELGQIDPRAVRFSLLRWFMFPVRTVRAFRGAVWTGEVQPAAAVAAADRARSERIARHNEEWLARQADKRERAAGQQ